MDLVTATNDLKGLLKVNVVLGKNGCGKSTLLKDLESNVSTDDIGRKRYVTPERGGVLVYEAGVEQNIVANPTWMSDVRRVNQFTQFKQQSVAQFRRLETSVYRESEEKEEIARFQPYVDKLKPCLTISSYGVLIQLSSSSIRIAETRSLQQASAVANPS
jgi:predicted ATPase